MSELTKNQLTGENNNSFPNNNTGYITPSILRTFNQNMIDSLVDEVQYNADSASFDADITALQQFSSSLDANFVTSVELSASASTLQLEINTKLSTASFNAYTASQTSVATGSLLTTASAVGNVITFTKGDGSTFPVSIATGSVIDSSSLVTTSSFNQYTQSAASGVSASINAATSSLSASIAVTDLAQSSSIAALQLFSSSLDSTFATDAQLSASASTLQNEINTKLNTASFNSYTASASSDVSSSVSASISQLSSSVAVTTLTINGKLGTGSFESYTSSNDARVNSLIEKTGSYATTGSNTFIGNQIVSGNLNISGNITATSASFQYVLTVFETASVIYSSGSNQFGDEASDVQTLYGSVRVVNQLTASGLNYPTADNGAKSFIQTDGAGNLSLQYVQTVYETIRNMSGGTLLKGTPVYISGSTGDNGDAYIADASDLNKMPAVYIAGETLNAGDTGLALLGGKIEGVDTSAYPAGTIIYVAEGGGWTDQRPSGSNSIVQVLGVVQKQGVGGQGVIINQLEAVLPNLQTGYVWVGNGTNQPVAISTSSLATDTGAYLTTASFNAYTASESSNVSASISSSVSALSSSVAVTTNGLDLEINGKLDSSSFNTFTASYEVASSSFDSRITALETGSAPLGTVSSSAQIVELGFLETGSFNTYTQSNDSKVDSLIAKTGSYITTGSTGLTQSITGSLVISGATFNAKVEAPTLSIGVTNLDTLFESTQSGVTSQIDITRLGAGPTGDLTGVRLQTLSGSDTAGDTLLSRVSTGVNRHTSTGMTGSVVNSTITSTWATGSAGGRVAYSSTINANAQSASATLTFNAGNAAANFAGGTASLSAGLVRIGAVGGTIATTGSLSHSGSALVNGDLRVTQNITASIISASSTIQTIKFEVTASSTNLSTAANIRVPDFNTTGSYINNIGQNNDTTVAGLLHIVNISSASMATLLNTAATSPNTIYFVI